MIEGEVYLYQILRGILRGVDERFDNLTVKGKKSGWKDQAVIGIILLAMTNEGLINAVAEKKAINGWSEYWPAKKKITCVTEHFLPLLAFDRRPLSSVEKVRTIRNEFAHAKPYIVARQARANDTDSDAGMSALFSAMEHPVEKAITPELYRMLRKDCETFWGELLEAARLSFSDISTKVQAFGNL